MFGENIDLGIKFEIEEALPMSTDISCKCYIVIIIIHMIGFHRNSPSNLILFFWLHIFEKLTYIAESQ